MKAREDIINETRATREEQKQTITSVNAPLASELKFEGCELDILFKSRLEAVNGECHILTNSTDVDVEIAAFLKRNDALDKVIINAEILNSFPELRKYSTCDAGHALVGISACELLVARTGTTIVTANEERQILGLSPIHVVLAKRSQLRATLEEALDELAEMYGPNFPSQLTLVTGPSRTTDIEKALVLGAHGHKRLIIMIY